MAVMISLPLSMQRDLCVDDHAITLYVNPNDNTDYVMYENNSEFFVAADDMDNYNFEGNHTILHRPLSTEIGVKRKRCEDHPTNVGPPFKLRKCSEEKMPLISFINYFMKSSWKEGPSESDLKTIYDVLGPFIIDQKALDVVTAAIQFMYTKTLVNTMRRNCERRNKKFKKQLQFILSAICKREASN